MAPARTTADFLYHVVLITSPSEAKDPNEKVEQMRIFGSYTSIEKAKEAAHDTLTSLGYDKQLFTTYETEPHELEKLAPTQGLGLAVYATTDDGSIFRVRILTTPNTQHFTTDKDGRIPRELYHVVQTNINYDRDERKKPNETNIEGAFETYADARKFAGTVLVSKEDGITPSSYREYHVAAPDAPDCGFAENVLVHAVGENGQNYLVSVIKAQ